MSYNAAPQDPRHQEMQNELKKREAIEAQRVRQQHQDQKRREEEAQKSQGVFGAVYKPKPQAAPQPGGLAYGGVPSDYSGGSLQDGGTQQMLKERKAAEEQRQRERHMAQQKRVESNIKQSQGQFCAAYHATGPAAPGYDQPSETQDFLKQRQLQDEVRQRERAAAEKARLDNAYKTAVVGQAAFGQTYAAAPGAARTGPVQEDPLTQRKRLDEQRQRELHLKEQQRLDNAYKTSAVYGMKN